MIEDNEIKTKVSPFAMRPGEIKVFDGKDGYISMNQILQKINLGQITDIHFKILELINKYEFLTSRQIYQLLQIENVEIKDQEKVNARLDNLIKNKIISRYYFKYREGNGVYRIYCMEKMGKYLLNSREIECKWQPSDNAKPVEMIKKKLVGNQIVIAYRNKVKNFDSFVLKPVIDVKTLSKSFKPISNIKLKHGNSEINFVFEVIRRNNGWENKLVERMLLWKEFYDNFVPGDSGYSNVPQLVFVCEDEKHMAEVFKVLVIKNIKIDKIQYYFTMDLAQNEEKLEKSFYNFVEENGKYKFNNPEIKILD